ncbi:hypothetical protein [Verrucomicrobium sp. BvORR034]|uniref:hypothetical protein n=1 Tax=Verrucomicrobium sp. BvORR034 TaxID=1396418 RepID=UPI000679454D|nr:hypothetical protein [Verrucomicrobium sp. BvORR034]
MFLTQFIYSVLRTLANITRDGFRAANMVALKAFPLLAIPIFLFTALGSIVLNDNLWNSTMQGVQFVQSSGAGSKGGFMVIYGKMNYFFPISESIMMVATLIPIKIVCTGIRMVKSCIPTVG